MRERLNKILALLRDPGPLVSFVTFLLMLASGAGAIAIAVINASSPLGYAVYALAALSLSYAVYISVKKAPALKRSVLALIGKSNIGRRLLSEHDLRTLSFAAVTFFINIAYSAVNAIAALLFSSARYLTLAVYYLLLTFMRGGVLIYHKKGRHKLADSRREAVRKLCITGVVIITLSVPVSIVVSFMGEGGAGYDSGGWIIYAVAAFTFTKLTLAILSAVRAKRSSDITVGALSSVGLADSAVSVLSLQAALLDTFGGEDSPLAFNAITGAAVTAFIIVLGISAILKSKSLKKDITNE